MNMKLIVIALGTTLAALSVSAGDTRDSRDHACDERRAADAVDGSLTAKQAKRYVSAQIPAAKVAAVRADETDTATPHYHVDLRLPHGAVGRLNVEAATGKLTWREPAVLRD